MNRFFSKPLLLLIPLLLFSFAYTHANNNSEHIFFLQNSEIQNFDNLVQVTDSATFTPHHQKHRSLFFSKITDFRDSEEKEEESNSDKEKVKQGNYLTPSYNSYCVKTGLYTFLRKPKHFQYYFNNTSVKLHLKFQVFII